MSGLLAREGVPSLPQEFISELRWTSEYERCLRRFGVDPCKQHRGAIDVLVIGSDEVFNCTGGTKCRFFCQLLGVGGNCESVISRVFGHTTLSDLESCHVADDVIASNASTCHFNLGTPKLQARILEALGIDSG